MDDENTGKFYCIYFDESRYCLKYVFISVKPITDCCFLPIKIHFINYHRIITSFLKNSGFLRQARKPSITSGNKISTLYQ